jgi:hypothetical protein
MVMAPQVLKVIGESEALEVMAPCMAAVAEVAVTTAVVVVVQMLTHAAPMLAVAAVDLHTPTQV